MKAVIEILIDYSGSMAEERKFRVDNEVKSLRKIEITKKIILEEIVPIINYAARVGIKTFSADQYCSVNICEVLPLRITDEDELFSVISGISEPNGKTPIAQAIKKSVDSLQEYRAYEKEIILITDGEETCNGDWIKESENAIRSGIECKIHIVGFELNQSARQQAEKITSITGGNFVNIASTQKESFILDNSSISAQLIGFRKSLNSSLSKPKKTNKNAIDQFLKKKSDKQKPEKPILKKEKPKNNSNPVSIYDLNQSQDNIPNIEKIVNNEIVINDLENIVDITENEALNERVRQISENYIYKLLHEIYGSRVKWLNRDGESLKDHDFEILDALDEDIVEYYIECKGTSTSHPYFYLTKKEWRLFLSYTQKYQVFLVVNALETPEIIKIDNLMDWILKEKVVPYSTRNIKLKAERVIMTVTNYLDQM